MEDTSPEELQPTSESAPRSRIFSFLKPAQSFSAKSAALLLAASSILSNLLGLVRLKYIAYIFGASSQNDAFQAAFELPDMINYFLIGGVASITLVTMLSRFRKDNDEAGENEAISVVLNAMLVVLGAGIVLAEIFAPLYTQYKFPKFDPATAALCTSLTRILLPAQLCFFAGGVLGSRMLVRRIFVYQALSPLVYNIGIILGGVLFSRVIGIYSFAWGVLIGVSAGPLLLNIYGAYRTGYHYKLRWGLSHPLFKEWLRLSLPLMVGVSIVTADKWVLSYFASADPGGITRLNMAKTIFMAPMGVLGQAAGAASMPFFAALFAAGKREEFSASVARSVSRVAAISLLFGAWMWALAIPLVTLLFRGGRFHADDATNTAHYFAIFTLSLAFWASQSIYARAFYAAGNTLTPAIAGTIITLLSLPVYTVLFHRFGMLGLAYASDAAILTHLVVLAGLLQMKGMVSLRSVEWGELLRCIVAAALSWFAVRSVLPHLTFVSADSHLGAAIRIAISSLVWGVVVAVVLLGLKSRLPQELRRRRA